MIVLIVDESGVLAGSVDEADKVLELVGPRTVRDSLKLLAPGGTCCQTGILGGAEAIDGFDPIKEIPNGRYLTGFFSNSPTQEAMDAVYDAYAIRLQGSLLSVISGTTTCSHVRWQRRRWS